MAEKKFPWGCVLGGCAVVALVCIGVVVAVTFFGVRKAKQFAENIKDPAARAEKVYEILGTDELPDGYHPVIGVSLPFVVDFAMIGDAPPQENGEPGEPQESGFLFFSVISDESGRAEVDDFVAGKRNDTSFMRQQNVDFDIRDVLGRGSFEQETKRVDWVAYRGEVEIKDNESDGLVSIMRISCPAESKRIRMGIWFGTDPNPQVEANAAEFDASGTPADPAAMSAFVQNMDLCAK